MTIIVKSGLSENRVALHEFDERHPNGEVFINETSGDVEVFETALVQRNVSRGILIKVADKPKVGRPSKD